MGVTRTLEDPKDFGGPAETLKPNLHRDLYNCIT